jgi:CO/xanthine dehydrogenase FAD-binding subunit
VSSESELRDALGEPGAVPLSGGTDLLVKMRSGLATPSLLVDLSRVESLSGIVVQGEVVRIGAATPEADLLASSLIGDRLPLLSSVLRVLGSAQIRHRGTLGGNLANASPAADSAIPLLLYDAQLEVVGQAGGRRIALTDFFVSPGKTVLRKGEYIRAIEIAPAPLRPGANWSGFFHKIGKRRALTISIASLGALVCTRNGRIDDARIAAGSVAPKPIRLRTVERILIGASLTGEVMAQARAAALAEVSPIDDVRATATYRREVVGDLLVRSLHEASPPSS